MVPFRSRILSHETKTLNEDKTLNQLVTAPLQKHAVGRRAVHMSNIYCKYKSRKVPSN